MISLARVVVGRPFNIVANAILSLAWAFFAYYSVRAFATTGSVAFLLFAITETLQALFFALREDPKRVATEPIAWMGAFLGTFAVLALRPGGEILWRGGEWMIVAGFTLQIAALLSLNTGFSIVAADRGVRTKHMYSLIRHPIYATYLVSTLGYLLISATPMNTLLFVVFFGATLLRIAEEERLLSLDPEYLAYAKRVRYRLIPFVY